MPSSTSETNIRFFRSGGHKHDGVSSSLIDFSQYSIFDFSTDVSLNGENNDREIARTDNQIRFDQYIGNFISTQILAPAGIILAPNSVLGQHIGAEEITAINIAANTITANNLAINVVQVGQTISSNNYSASTTGWQIRSDGSAEFNNNVTITGNITAGSASSISGSGVTGGTISGTAINIGTGAFTVSSAGALVANSATIIGNITAGSSTTITNGNVTTTTITGGTITGTAINVGSGAFTVSNAGALVATSATITGNITAGSASTITGGDIRGGTLIIGTDVTDANTFRVYSNGFFTSGGTTATGALFRVSQQGEVRAQAGTIGGWTLSNTSIDGGSTTLYSNGRIDAGNAVIYANGRASFVNGTNYSLTAGGVLDMINGTIAGLTISSTTLAQGSLTMSNSLSVLNSNNDGTQITGSKLNFKIAGSVVASIDGYTSTYNGLYTDVYLWTVANCNIFNIIPTSGYAGPLFYLKGTGTFHRGTGTALVRNGTSGQVYETSSRRELKENINTINTGCELIKKFNPVTYNWRTNPLASDVEKYFNALNTQYGFIVEEVEEIDTGLVNYAYALDNTNEKEIDYTDPNNFSPSMYDPNGILSISVSALKEVLERLEVLENKIGD